MNLTLNYMNQKIINIYCINNIKIMIQNFNPTNISMHKYYNTKL